MVAIALTDSSRVITALIAFGFELAVGGVEPNLKHCNNLRH